MLTIYNLIDNDTSRKCHGFSIIFNDILKMGRSMKKDTSNYDTSNKCHSNTKITQNDDTLDSTSLYI